MAERAAEYLKSNPNRPMVILAGVGHVAYGHGIPQRLQRRVKLSSAVVLSDPQETLSQELADFVLLPAAEQLPPKGRMGLLMQSADKGVRIASFLDASAAKSAGMKKDDRIVQIDGEPVKDTADVELALLDRKSGESVEIGVLRKPGTRKEELLRYRVKLQ
jgi:S1-C subfamily serine protease